MTTNVKRIELDFDISNPNAIIAIQAELTAIDVAGGTLVDYSEYYDFGDNHIHCTFIYTLP